MGKLSLTGASLAASIPAGILGYVLLMSVINNLNDMPTLLKGVVMATLAVALAVVLFTLYLLVWHRSGQVAAGRSKNAVTAAEPALAAAAVGGSELADSFLDEFEHDGNEIEGDLREEEVFGSSGEFVAADDQSFEDGGFDAYEAGEGGFDADQTVQLNQEMSEDDFLNEFGGGDTNPTLEFETDDSFSAAEVDEFSAAHSSGSDEDDADLLAGGGIDDDFNFELFEDEEDKKK